MAVDEAPRYIVFAGVNGAGKSTLFRSGMWSSRSGDMDLPRVNSDEILVAHGWDWRDEKAQIRAGKEAVRMMDGYLASGVSFNQETTLSGRTILRRIRQAVRSGYSVTMHYIGVESPDIANERIRNRVSRGGHAIPTETVERRFRSSLSNLVQAVPLCEDLYVFDNTDELKMVACFDRGELVHHLKFPHYSWLEGVLSKISR